MESRVLTWDPNEYTLSHIDIAKTRAAKQAKKAEEGKEQEEGKEDEPKSEDKKVEVDAIDVRPIDTDVEQMAGKLAELADYLADTALLLPSYSELLSISSILTPVAQFYGGTTEGYIE
ncbi:hypothetical protein PENNAL_c0055G05262 [Penicillium nalgiovense]|uniref:Uncharacterized protein n=1 Tax=Penicillium nalgiovense TaxID=60175 RepID=A0A1V6XU37_PENNA|nr:hypothetical protein PENNAL_c0055G05262 [Penicillium nalgiovense]